MILGKQGLSLTNATHVFLLEPLLNLEQEAQAVNRVHRVGQTRPTYVHRYVIRDTVEEKLHNLRVRKLEAAGGMDRVLQLAHGGHKTRVRGLKHTQDDQEELTLEDIEAMFDS
jgi:SNF2 family DNA or RNA helicase